MNQFSGYIFLVLAVIFGIASNSSLKMTDGFTKLVPSIYCSILIVLCILCLAKAMMTIPKNVNKKNMDENLEDAL